MEAKEILNISRKLLNLQLICPRECNLMREKSFKDIHDLLQYLSHELDLDVETLDINKLLND